jgi:hypothetical protein
MIMLLPLALSFTIVFLSTVTIAILVEAVAMGSKHNLIPVTYEPGRDCLLILCGPKKPSYSAVSYFAKRCNVRIQDSTVAIVELLL